MVNLTSPGWVKLYGDKSFIVGTDRDVRRGRVSWRLSSSSGMIGAGISDGKISCYILSPGEYWESQDMEAGIELGKVQATTVVRRIQKKIEKGNNFLALVQNGTHWRFELEQNHRNPTAVPVIDYEGQWLTVEIHQDSSVPVYYIHEVKI